MKKNSRILIYSFVTIGVFFMLTNSCKQGNDKKPPSTVTDIDGNVYHTVTIGDQVWMVENLKTTKYRDGSTIPNVSDGSSWIILNTGAYCHFENDSNWSKTFDGVLYNWYAVNDSRNIAPKGWHVPNYNEWMILEYYLVTKGYNYDGSTQGNKIAKSLASAKKWQNSTNPGSVGNTDYPTYRNKTGFTALPSGCRHCFSNGSFGSIGSHGYWWSATESGTKTAWYRYMGSNSSKLGKQDKSNKENGFSIRCVMD